MVTTSLYCHLFLLLGKLIVETPPAPGESLDGSLRHVIKGAQLLNGQTIAVFWRSLAQQRAYENDPCFFL